MKITITQNNLTYERTIPTRWEEVTFKQFLDLHDCGDDYVKIFSVLTGVDVEIIKKAKIAGADKVIELLGFLKVKPADKLPKTIIGYKIPSDLGLDSLEQYEDLKQTLRESKDFTPKQQLEQYALYCAIYACRQEFGDYDIKKAESIAKYFYNAPAMEVLAVGNFTLLKLIGLRKRINAFSQKPNTRLRNWKLALIGWAKHMAFSLRYLMLARKWGISRKS